MPKARVQQRANKQCNWSFEPSYCRPPALECLTRTKANVNYNHAMSYNVLKNTKPCYAAPPELAAADRAHYPFGSYASTPVVRRGRRRVDPCNTCNVPRWSPTDCQQPARVDDFTRTRRNVHGDYQSALEQGPPAPDFKVPRTIVGPHSLPPVCCVSPTKAKTASRRRPADADASCNFPRWSPTDCQRPARVDDFTRTRQNVHGDDHSALEQASPAPDFKVPRTTIVGPHSLPPVCCVSPTKAKTASRRRPADADASCNVPRWSPTDCQQPARVDDFTRTRQNVHGDDQSRLEQAPAANFKVPRTTGPHTPPPVRCVAPTEANEADSRWRAHADASCDVASAPSELAAADRAHYPFGSYASTPVVRRIYRRVDPCNTCDGPRWSPTDCQRAAKVDDFTRTRRNVHGDDQSTLEQAPPGDFKMLHLPPPVRCVTPTEANALCGRRRADADTICDLPRWSATDCQRPARVDDFTQTCRNIHGDQFIYQSTLEQAPPADFEMLHSPPAVRCVTPTEANAVCGRRRAVADTSCDFPRWSPTDCQRPARVDDFARPRWNIHGDYQSPLELGPPTLDFNVPQTTILGPHPPSPVCCPHSGASTSLVCNDQFERTKYNIIGPQKPAPLRFPLRSDDFVNSKRNLFGPAVTLPLRFPQRTSDLDDTSRNVFGHTPFCARSSTQPYQNTFNRIHGKALLNAARTVTPLAAKRQNISSMAGHSEAPQSRYYFDNICHLFGVKAPIASKSENRQVLLTGGLFRAHFGKRLLPRDAMRKRGTSRRPVSVSHTGVRSYFFST